MNYEALAAPFPPEAIHWRAQNLIDGPKALALAYINARDVMRRLDAVVGPENWQDAYVETARGRIVCTLSIRIGNEWIGKSDGAGDTDVEGEKGGMSDAFKRAAVKWGIGRYLYETPTVFAPCELGRNGKWRAWAGNSAKLFEVALEKAAKAAHAKAPDNEPEQKRVQSETGGDALPGGMPDAEWSRLVNLAEASGTTSNELAKRYKVRNLKALTVEQYTDALDFMNDRLAEKAREGSDKSLADELGDDVPF